MRASGKQFSQDPSSYVSLVKTELHGHSSPQEKPLSSSERESLQILGYDLFTLRPQGVVVAPVTGKGASDQDRVRRWHRTVVNAKGDSGNKMSQRCPCFLLSARSIGLPLSFLLPLLISFGTFTLTDCRHVYKIALELTLSQQCYLVFKLQF